MKHAHGDRAGPMTLFVLACSLVFATVALAFATPALADMVARESDISGIRLGQHYLVDDGSCPAGQIKQITGNETDRERHHVHQEMRRPENRKNADGARSSLADCRQRDALWDLARKLRIRCK